LITAAGALLMTSGESPTPSQSDHSVASVIPSASSSDSAGSPVPSPSSSASVIPTPGPSATPEPKAPIAQVTFNNLMLDATTDALGRPRTFTFVTDGSGPVGIAIIKSAGTAMTKICAKVDDSKADCRTGRQVSFKGAYTDTAHSVWVVTLIGPVGASPLVDVAFSWPTRNARITLTHGRLQGSSSPGISEYLNGFTATFKTNAAGNVTVASSWTVITTDVKVKTEEVSGTSLNLQDQKAFTSATNLGTPGYTFGVGGGKFFRVSLRNTSANNGRPDLTAVLSVP
jgi:hypothetical protein